MAKNKSCKVILLPIQPQFADAIFSGKKTVEFRKNNIPDDINFVVVYAASPRKKIIGFFEVSHITKDDPETLYNRFKKVGCVSKGFFSKYYVGHKEGKAIHVRSVKKAKKPLSLSFVERLSSPPQSFTYLDELEWRKIKDFCLM